MKINEPINNIKWIAVEDLKANDYNPNHVFKKELALIARSILENGWLHPIIINQDKTIIDGYHRATLMKANKKINQKTAGLIPCIILDLSDAERKILTIRINRAKGTQTAYKVSEVIKELNKDYNIPANIIAKEIGADISEINLLLEDDVFTMEKFKENSLYNQAWIPRKQ